MLRVSKDHSSDVLLKLAKWDRRSCHLKPCTDPEIFVRVQVSLTKKSPDVFFFFFFFSPQLILQKPNGQSIIFQGSRGGPTFSRGGGGVQLFPGGVQLLIPFRNTYNLWFSRGGPDPLSPPLDPHLEGNYWWRSGTNRLWTLTETNSSLWANKGLIRKKLKVKY